MTNPDYTAISMLIDRSGSMKATRQDAIGGMSEFIADQRKLPGKCTLRVAHFDTEYTVVHQSTSIDRVPDPRLDPRGLTALYDAWGQALTEFGAELEAMPEDERPGTVIFVVVTDGGENASREWTQDKVFEAVTRQTDEYGWKFLYLGANQDAMNVGSSLGVPATMTMAYNDTGEGTRAAYASASATVSSIRTTGKGSLSS